MNEKAQIDAIRLEVENELEDELLKKEFDATKDSRLDSTFDPNLTRDGDVVMSGLKGLAFPVALNSRFDAQAFLMV